MGKLYSFKSGEEIKSVAELTPVEINNKLIELEDALLRLGLTLAADNINDARDTLVRKIKHEERVMNRATLKRQLALKGVSE